MFDTERHGPDWASYTIGDLTVDFERMGAHRREIRAEAAVLVGGKVLWGRTDVNLLGANTFNKTVAAHCAEQMPDVFGSQFDPDGRVRQWWKLLTTAKNRAIRHWRAGDPLTDLQTVEPATERWLIGGFMEGAGATVLAAPGGSGKSYVAMAAAVTIRTGRGVLGNLKPTATGPVVYVDYEDEAKGQAQRLGAVCAGFGIDRPDGILYRAQSVPLTQSAKDLARMVSDVDAAAVIVDSKGGAIIAGSNSDGGASATNEFFNALRMFPCPALVVDHVPSESVHGRGKARMFGSIYGENRARAVWATNKVARLDSGFLVSYEATKANRGRVGDKLAFELEMEAENDVTTAVRVTQVSSRDPRFSEVRGTISEKLTQVGGERASWSVKELGLRLGEKTNSVTQALRRSMDWTADPSSPGHWFYTPREAAE